MEFRIAPLLISIFNFIYLIATLFILKNATLKTTLICLGIIALAYGAYKSHSYYTKNFTLAFYIINALNLVLSMSIYFLYVNI